MTDVAWVVAVAAALGAYEVGRSRKYRDARGWPPARRRSAWAAAALLALAGLPPLDGMVRSHLWAETVQFALIAFGAAPLAALAAPLGLLPARHVRLAPRPGNRRWGPALAAFVAVTFGWRLPAAVGAAGSGHGWLAVEAVTILVGSWWLWAALLGSDPRPALDHRTGRIALAAGATWSVWIFAWVVGLSAHPFYPAYAGSGAMGSQELGVGLLWLISAAALCPVMFLNLIRWLAADQALAETEVPFLRGHHG